MLVVALASVGCDNGDYVERLREREAKYNAEILESAPPSPHCLRLHSKYGITGVAPGGYRLCRLEAEYYYVCKQLDCPRSYNE